TDVAGNYGIYNNSSYDNYFAGNVGVGTTTPSEELDVNGNAIVDTMFASAFSSNSPLLLQTDGTTRIYVDDVTGNVGVGTISPNTSSILDVTSTEKGILIPRMTNAQISTFGSTLGASDKGMIVFNTDDIKQEYWDGTAWKTMVTKSSSPGSSSDETSFCSEGVTDYDGHKYKSVKIGDQCWMAENLKSTSYADGSAITGHWAYDDDEGNAHTYGRYYTWFAVMNGAGSSNINPSGVQGVCPNGWHVPSDAEWKELDMTLGMTTTEADSTGWRGSHSEGRKLKETDEAFLWIDDANYRGTNNSGFTALPGGYRSSSGYFYNMGVNATFWSSAEDGSFTAWYRILYYNNSNVSRYYGNKYSGYSVRCLRDN
ncbi:MAG: hypothetical protein GY746_16310, partial [Gammaproteobacteria bacterium]|nr:hypothetical protein [Gammaproteobacteria bacterium]